MQTTHAVLYHGGCPDGFGSAHIIRRVFLEKGIEADYIPCYHGSELKDEWFENLVDKHIYVVDFSFQYEISKRIMDASRSFLIMDHHTTAEKELINIPPENKIFDMKRSGVGIVWDYFHPNQPLPLYLQYIQDRDLWKHELPDCHAFITYFHSLPKEFQVWDEFANGGTFSVSNAINIGKQLLEYKNSLINECLKKVAVKTHLVDGVAYHVAYLTGTPFSLVSDVANATLEKYPLVDFCVVVSQWLEKEETSFSLRSREGDVKNDVSIIAKTMGGGGHPCAAGAGRKDLIPYLNFGEMVASHPKALFMKGVVEDGLVVLEELGSPEPELVQTPHISSLYKETYGPNIKGICSKLKTGSVVFAL